MKETTYAKSKLDLLTQDPSEHLEGISCERKSAYYCPIVCVKSASLFQLPTEEGPALMEQFFWALVIPAQKERDLGEKI